MILLFFIPPLVFGFAAYAASKFLVGQSIAFASRKNVLDQPGERSSHEAPTPRLGGVGMIPVILVLTVVGLALFPVIQRFLRLTVIDPLDWTAWGGALGAVAVAFALGLWDDVADPPALAKLAGQLVLAVVLPFFGLRVFELSGPYAGVWEVPLVLGHAIASAWMLLAMNAVNFMDGVNGLAGRTGQIFGVFLLAAGINASWRVEFGFFGAILTGASFGFLVYNFPKARTFLGDGGSQALGMIVAVGALLLHQNRLWLDQPPAAPPRHDAFLGAVLVVSPLLLDVVYTLVRRTLRRENLLRPHREHLYQRYLKASGGDHEAACWHVEKTMYATGIGGYLVVSPQWGASDGLALAGWAIAIVALGLYVVRTFRAERGVA